METRVYNCQNTNLPTKRNNFQTDSNLVRRYSEENARLQEQQKRQITEEYGQQEMYDVCTQKKSQFSWTGSKLGKEHIKAVHCHPAYLTYMQSTSHYMLGWMKHKLESRLSGEISITSDTQIAPLLQQKARGTKEPLDESEREE